MCGISNYFCLSEQLWICLKFARDVEKVMNFLMDVKFKYTNDAQTFVAKVRESPTSHPVKGTSTSLTPVWSKNQVVHH